MIRTRKTPRIVLTVSGSDPSGGAGLEADLKTFHQHGVFGMAIPTLLTVQNSRGVEKVRFLDPDFLADQWRALFADFRPSAIKIGALGSRDMVRCIGSLLRTPQAKTIPVVLDPILVSTSGSPLLEPAALPDLVKRIFPLCRVVTPNAVEFSLLCGKTITSENAEYCLRQYAQGKSFAILLKGGHLNGKESTDLLWDGGKVLRLQAKRLRSGNTHGTGCVLASALAANLASPVSLATACRRAKIFVNNAIATAPKLGHGRGPLNLWAND